MEIFGKNSFIGYSCYISHGLPSDTLTVEILLEKIQKFFTDDAWTCVLSTGIISAEALIRGLMLIKHGRPRFA